MKRNSYTKLVPVEINPFNLNTGVVKQHHYALYSNTHYHNVIVTNVGNLDRLTVLTAIMKFCKPAHFIPVNYEKSPKTASFLIKGCGAALEKICKNSLLVPNPQENAKPLRFSFQLCALAMEDVHTDIEENIRIVLSKRFNTDDGVLDLDNFVADDSLNQFFPLSQPKLLLYLLYMSRYMGYKHLILTNNEIEDLEPFEVLNDIKRIVAIDLRNNCLSDIDQIGKLKRLYTEYLWLEGNPLCNDYDEYSYIHAVRQRLSCLHKLDNVDITSGQLSILKRNFLCCRDGYELIDQFLEHYFTLYDMEDRSSLEGIYHGEALFSLTADYMPLQSTSRTSKLTPYKKISRNLLQISDTSKSDYLYIGEERILQVLKTLPRSEHDPFSFTVDLISFSEKAAIFVVSGVFREMLEGVDEPKRLLNFNRTFVLQAKRSFEYSIVNEMMHISNATTAQASVAFNHVRFLNRGIQIPRPDGAEEELEVVRVLKGLTGMNTAWTKKCLQDCDYSLGAALKLFIDLYKVDMLPKSAFNSLNDDITVDINLKSLLPKIDEIRNKERPFTDVILGRINQNCLKEYTLLKSVIDPSGSQANVPSRSEINWNPPVANVPLGTPPVNNQPMPINPQMSPVSSYEYNFPEQNWHFMPMQHSSLPQTFPPPVHPVAPMPPNFTLNFHLPPVCPLNIPVSHPVNPIKPVVHPMLNVQTRIPQNETFGNVVPMMVRPRPFMEQQTTYKPHKKAPRTGLVKINLKK